MCLTIKSFFNGLSFPKNAFEYLFVRFIVKLYLNRAYKRSMIQSEQIK